MLASDLLNFDKFHYQNILMASLYFRNTVDAIQRLAWKCKEKIDGFPSLLDQ